MCVVLEFVDVDGIVVIVDVATTVATAAVVTAVVAVGMAMDVAAATTTAVAAAGAAVITDTAAATVAVGMISVRAPDAKHIGKASIVAIEKASTTQSRAIQDTAAVLPPIQPGDPDQLSPKAAAVATANIN